MRLRLQCRATPEGGRAVQSSVPRPPQTSPPAPLPAVTDGGTNEGASSRRPPWEAGRPAVATRQRRHQASSMGRTPTRGGTRRPQRRALTQHDIWSKREVVDRSETTRGNRRRYQRTSRSKRSGGRDGSHSAAAGGPSLPCGRVERSPCRGAICTFGRRGCRRVSPSRTAFLTSPP